LVKDRTKTKAGQKEKEGGGEPPVWECIYKSARVIVGKCRGAAWHTALI